MKALLLTIVIYLLFNPSLSFSQCRQVYVWNFYTDEGEVNSFTVEFADSFEEGMKQCGNCQIVQRRHIDSLHHQKKLEKNLTNGATKLSNVAQDSQDILTTQGAQVVVFGKLAYDAWTGEVTLRVSFQNIFTTEILKIGSVSFTRKEAQTLAGQKRISRRLLNEISVCKSK